MSSAPGHRGAVIAVIRGTVQGVGFRYSSQLAADRLGVTGWVRNLSDGAVEAHLEGTPEAVAAMVAWLQVGPPGSAVSRVTTREVVTEGYGRFSIRR